MIERAETAVARLRLVEAAVVQADDGETGSQRCAGRHISFAADRQFDSRARSGALGLGRRLGIEQADKSSRQLAAMNGQPIPVLSGRRAAADVVPHVEQANRSRHFCRLVEPRLQCSSVVRDEVLAMLPEVSGQLIGQARRAKRGVAVGNGEHG